MDTVELIINSVAALAGIMAIGIAVWTNQRTSNALIRERRNEHELNLLRDIGEVAHDALAHHGNAASELRTMLLALPSSEDLGLLRALYNARPDELSVVELSGLKTFGPSLTEVGSAGVTPWEAELEEAINRRLNRW